MSSHICEHVHTQEVTISHTHIGISSNKDPDERRSPLLSLLCASVTTSIFVCSCLLLSVEKPDYSSDEFPCIWILVNCIHVVLLATFLWSLHPLLFLKSSRSFVLFPSLACLCLANGWHVSLPQEVVFIGDFFYTETLIHIHELKRGYTMVITILLFLIHVFVGFIIHEKECPSILAWFSQCFRFCTNA